MLWISRDPSNTIVIAPGVRSRQRTTTCKLNKSTISVVNKALSHQTKASTALRQNLCNLEVQANTLNLVGAHKQAFIKRPASLAVGGASTDRCRNILNIWRRQSQSRWLNTRELFA